MPEQQRNTSSMNASNSSLIVTEQYIASILHQQGCAPSVLSSDSFRLAAIYNKLQVVIVSQKAHVIVTVMSQWKVRVMATYMVLLVRLLLPVLLAAFRALPRYQRHVVESVRYQLGPAIFAFVANSISLSSLSGLVPGKTDATPLLRQLGVSAEPERCVTCDVLHGEAHAGAARRADVVFIHGLHGSLVNTWKQGVWRDEHIKAEPLRRTSSASDVPMTSPSLDHFLCSPEEEEVEPEPYSACWPRDWLPQDCPGVRVIALNYTTDPFLWRPLWVTKRNRTDMQQRSQEMVEHLLRLGVGERPLVWVGHSKGGLFVKQMLVNALESGCESLSQLYRNTKAIMFYSVPHRGSACADINLPLLRQSIELTEVQKDSRFVLELHTKFLAMVEAKHLQAEVFSFIETVQTFMRILYIQIVSLESADAGVGELHGAPLDHRNICKPTNRQCFLYKELTSLINRTV